MKRIKKFLSGWFGYDRRERRANLFVLIIVLITGFSRYTVRGRHEIPVFSQIPEAVQPSVNDSLPVDVTPGSELAYRQYRPAKALINLNLCDSAELEALPGIGPVLSARIIKYRNLLGGYADVRQLLEVYGLKEEVYEIIKTRVMTDTALLKKICVNSDSWSSLLRHPYLEPEHVRVIVRYREQAGTISDWKTMVSNNMVPPEKGELLRYYIKY